MSKDTHHTIFGVIVILAIVMGIGGATWWIVASADWGVAWDIITAQPPYILLFYGGLLLFIVIVPIGKFFERFIIT